MDGTEHMPHKRAHEHHKQNTGGHKEGKLGEQKLPNSYVALVYQNFKNKVSIASNSLPDVLCLLKR